MEKLLLGRLAQWFRSHGFGRRGLEFPVWGLGVRKVYRDVSQNSGSVLGF